MFSDKEMKAFANRTQDWADVESIILKQRGKLDRFYINREFKAAV